MRINKRCSPAGIDILKKKIFHQPRLTGPRPTNDMEVPPPIFIGDGKWKRLVPHVARTKIYGMRFVIHTSKTSPLSTQKPEMVSSFSSQKENGLLRRVSKKNVCPCHYDARRHTGP